jgi:hypothetical protein
MENIKRYKKGIMGVFRNKKIYINNTNTIKKIIDSLYNKERFDSEERAEFQRAINCLSACKFGKKINYAILNDIEQEIIDHLKQIKECIRNAETEKAMALVMGLSWLIDNRKDGENLPQNIARLMNDNLTLANRVRDKLVDDHNGILSKMECLIKQAESLEKRTDMISSAKLEKLDAEINRLDKTSKIKKVSINNNNKLIDDIQSAIDAYQQGKITASIIDVRKAIDTKKVCLEYLKNAETLEIQETKDSEYLSQVDQSIDAKLYSEKPSRENARYRIKRETQEKAKNQAIEQLESNEKLKNDSSIYKEPNSDIYRNNHSDKD